MFGFITFPLGAKITDISLALRMINAHILAMGTFFVTLIKWIFCIVLYSLVYITYPKDLATMQFDGGNSNHSASSFYTPFFF